MKPLFSIVTVVFNGEKDIERTIQSCIGQDYPNKEYIIIDGASKDNTTGIIEKYRSSISYFVSESDNGIYDAMNKAIKAAKGEWVLFMNSGDLFCDISVLSKIAEVINNTNANPDILYGNTLYRYKKSFLKTIPMQLDLIEREMVFCHQSTLVKTELIKSSPFDLKFIHAADYEMMLRYYREKREFLYLDIYISVFNQVDGNSLRNFFQSTRERYSMHKDKGTYANFFRFYATIVRMGMGIMFKKILTEKMSERIFLRKYADRLV